MAENIFADEWMECLEAHYIHVIRTRDHVTEPSLTIVMHSAGFNDSQLAELRVRATMHMDDVSADFVPDLDILESDNHQNTAPEKTEPQIYNIPVNLAPPTDDTPPPVEDEFLTEADESPEAEHQPEVIEDETPYETETETQDPEEPQQLSMF